MRKPNSFFLSLFATLLPLFFSSQNSLDKIKWDTLPSASIAVDPLFLKYDNVILQEKVLCSFTEEDSIVMTVFVHYKINTEKGKEYFNSFCFPESFDPLTDYFGVPADLWKKITRPNCSACKLISLGARRLEANKSPEEINFEIIETEEGVYTPAGRISTEGTRYSLKNISVGNEIQMYIRYKIPLKYFTEYSRRFFFSGRFPKQKYELEFINSFKELSINFYQANNAGNFLEKFPHEFRAPFFRWKLTNLFPLYMEGCFRPSKELPFVVLFYTDRWNYVNVQKKNWNLVLKEGIDEMLKYSPLFQHIYEINYNYPAISSFIKEKLKDVKDTSRIIKLNYLHNTIIQDFDLYSIREKFESGDKKTTIDQYFEKKLFYEGGIDLIYRELAKQTGNSLNPSEIFDNRHEYYDTSNYLPVNNKHYCFTLRVNENSLSYYTPKNPGCSYFADELPFYEENSTALIPITRDIGKGKAAFLIASTPSSRVSENVRQIAYEAKIDSLGEKIFFSGKLVLSGQFSTLCRNLYLKKPFDLSINSCYWKKPFPTINFSANKKENLLKQESTFPFKTEFEIGFDSEDLLKKNGNTMSVDFTGIINHIIWENADLRDTVLSYYNDFRFKDVYRIKLKVPDGYKLSPENAPNQKIVNGFAKYEFKVADIGNGFLLIESSFLSDVDSVEPTKKQLVAEIYAAIKANKNFILKLQKI